jgi:asparagine synthase (glutamine-hydrolysing)
MCGLAGELRFDGERADPAAVVRMCDSMARRGPDDAGLLVRGPLALGHRRLQIIDLSAAGAQPMVDAQLGLSLVFNGCIYNYGSLRDELMALGHRFFSTSDTEVVLKSYAQWGPDCVEHFLGMFAFAIAERDTGRLVLARDRLGIKPMYIDHQSDRIRFASTLQALLAAGGVDTSVDPVALHHYLTFHAVVPPPRTILTGVRKLPPATVRIVNPDGSSADHVYWRASFDRHPDRADWSETDWQEALLDSLGTAVRRRMVADVPVGVLLSGGLDSSLIVALLAQQGQQGLSTFSIGFETVGGERGDEFSYSDLIAAEFGTKHHRIKIDSGRLLPAIDDAVAAMSEPMTSHDCVAFYLLSEEVAKEITVVQSGQGADEVLAGYDWYPPVAAVARHDAVAEYSRVFFDRSHAEMESLLNPEWLSDDVSAQFVAERFARAGAPTSLDAALRNDTEVMLVDDPVKRVDNMTMAWGLEARVPFLDHEFVELAASIPGALKLAGGGKGVLKAASRRLLPAQVIDRPKGYFPVPAIRQMDGAVLERVRAALGDPSARRRGLYRSAAIDSLLDDPNGARTTLGANALWQVGVLEMWLQTMDVR